MSLTYRLSSLNINGHPKLNDFAALRDFFRDVGIACFQETGDVDDSFVLEGHSKFSIPAVRTRGRSSCGLATFISNGLFGSCSQLRIPAPFDWVLPVRIANPSSGLGILVLNVYAPR